MARARVLAVLNAAMRMAWVMGLVIAGFETSVVVCCRSVVRCVVGWKSDPGDRSAICA
jgi:hypothetical protein